MNTKAPKSSGNFVIAKGAVVCAEAQLTGDVTIGTQTVVHPSAKILAEGGPIIIGEGNLIQEEVTIINRKPENGEEATPLIIGRGNVFEVKSHCESKCVGDFNTLEAKSFVGPRVTVTEQCVIGAGCTVDSMETISPNTVMYGSKCTRYVKTIPAHASNQQQLEYLIKVLPNYHHLTKSTS